MFSLLVNSTPKQYPSLSEGNFFIDWDPCRDPGSNRGPLDLQSNALPTELSRLVIDTIKITRIND